MQGDRVPLALATAEQLQRPGDDPAVELLDDPGALGGLDEGGRRQQLAVVRGHPQQQLVALDPARGEAADRLRVQAEPIVGDRVADPRRRGLHAARVALRLIGVAEQHRPVAPFLLGLVHRLVGGDQHRLVAFGVLGPVHRDADADRHRIGLGRRAGALGDLRAQVLAELHRTLESVCGISTASSSPESRATMSVVRTRSRMILAISRIRLSPAWWPRLSLTALSPSMSMIITAPWPP